MSRSSSLYRVESGDPPGNQAGAQRPEQGSSPPAPNAQQNSVMNLPNISISTVRTLVQDGDNNNNEEKLGNKGKAPENPGQDNRYDGPLNSADMTETGYRYAEEGLTKGLYGSLACENALRMIELRDSTNQLSDGDAFSNPHTPSGKWRCCKCKRGHEIYTFTQGQHPVGVLGCVCTHRSCSKCTLEGLIKHFVPMSEPEVVPLSEDKLKAIRFGVFCDGCGLSWRAKKVEDKTPVKCALQRISEVPRRLTKRGAQHLERVRESRSMTNLQAFMRPDASMSASKSVLNLRALSNEMEKEHGAQAEFVAVKFAGIVCTCGMTTDTSTSLCFQMVDPPKDFHRAQFVKQMAERKEPAGFGTTPEDQARGHGTPTLTLKGGRVRHANPLRSNPVD
ncbi:hypothetical protein BDW02DRAFT_587248 [Decorospora gaudefroyi]|uniref:Probable double zinc ribbon domain-containing protein n=1 Tax=Decorospora gaudefroyi TaxID=184978 RepID=A0A6A5KMY6_9PLEO|nr:hypothetical protein BDW02DRAFT_587248 [Decorospora gaudefroyi]